MTKTHTLSLTLKASELEQDPLAFTIKALDSEREELVERFGLVSLDSLEAEGSVRNKGLGEGVLVKGHLKAKLAQHCIVSLGEVVEELDTSFELLLVDPEMADRMDEDESYLDPDAPEYDALEGDDIAVGEIVAQTLSISMNPYPKISGADVNMPQNANISMNEPELEKPNPFAALSKLKDKS